MSLNKAARTASISSKKLPGRFKAGEITFTRRLGEDGNFEKWIKDSRFGKMGDAAKNGRITVYNNDGSILKRYKVTACWPKSLEISTMKAGDTSVLTEKLVVTYETMEPE